MPLLLARSQRVRTLIPKVQQERIRTKHVNLTKDLTVAREEFLEQALTTSDKYDQYVYISVSFKSVL